MILLVLKIEESMIFLVKYSIIYFSPKNWAAYTKKFFTNNSIIFFKKKSTYKPDCTNLKKLKVTILNFNIIYLYIILNYRYV